jgi:putative DNA methylase
MEEPFDSSMFEHVRDDRDAFLDWRQEIAAEVREGWELRWVKSHSYLERVRLAKRPEEIDEPALYDPIWDEVNDRLGTDAHSFPQLIEQLGILRFGHRPRVGDTFCGAGSIPFEAARLGCDVYASDLNPIACLLTWGALHIVGGDDETRRQIGTTQKSIVEAVNREITDRGIEHDEHGNRAKAYLWCLEAVSPLTNGWRVPMATSWVISKRYRNCARLVPNPAEKRFEIQIVDDASDEELSAAETGTVQDGDLVWRIEDETFRVSIATVRGDYRLPDGTSGNRLRRWEKTDFVPRPDDVFQERLYCVQWMGAETLHRGRPKFFFAAPTQADLERERKVEAIVCENLAAWQAEGLVPEMPIEPGEKTDEPIRTRGWTYWHHLFSPRHLLIGALIRKQMLDIRDPALSTGAAIGLCRLLPYMSKLTRWNVGFLGRPGVPPSGDTVKDVFYNQALNTFFNYGSRAFLALGEAIFTEIKEFKTNINSSIGCISAQDVADSADLLISDPPYADAINYHEITEYFIAWLRRNPPIPNWLWDSRRALAIKGKDEGFRKAMVEAYRTMAAYMPDNGMQIVMFTHQDAGVWADMAQIMWGAGLQVTAAWYIATETTSELKKGGYVQGTVLLVLRKRRGEESAYKDELMQELKGEVARQIDTMVGLNQRLKGHGRIESLFEDADLQMAGYAAALRVLTGYTRIDSVDMTQEALRPRKKGEKGIVGEIIDFAVQVANEHLVPDGLTPAVWERLTGPERFYLKMLDIELTGAKKIDNYQNFAKAFRVADYGALMGSMKPNAARLKTAAEFKRSEFGETGFGASLTRATLYALYELGRETDVDEVTGQLRDLVKGYYARRDDVIAIVRYLSQKREKSAPAEAEAARILLARVQSERLG